MLKLSLAALLAAADLSGCASAPPQPATGSPSGAASHARPFSMRPYVFVLLRRGSAWSAEETLESKRLFEGHMANIEAMGRAGKLVLAGPFDAPAEDRNAYAGLFVLDAKTEDEARALLANDPAIAAGRLVPEFRSWYGPAGITFDGGGQVAP